MQNSALILLASLAFEFFYWTKQLPQLQLLIIENLSFFFLKIKRFPECHIPQYNATFSCLIVKIDKIKYTKFMWDREGRKSPKKKWYWKLIRFYDISFICWMTCRREIRRNVVWFIILQRKREMMMLIRIAVTIVQVIRFSFLDFTDRE